ncbi:MAG: hypothetical protein V1873_01460 [Verrucomicrobiota bacterium]
MVEESGGKKHTFMRLRQPILAGVTALLALAYSACAQTSLWSSMAVAGDLNGWNPVPNMTNTANNQWTLETYVYKASRIAFKFVADNTWDGTNEWGKINQTNFAVPLYDFADFETNDIYGKDIVISNTVSGIYRFWLDDSTGEFSVELIETIAAYNYQQVAVAGDLNGWSSVPNMDLVSNSTWQAELYAPAASSSKFKFVPHTRWDLNWGESNQTVVTVPMTNTAEYLADYGKDIQMQNIVAGLYQFTFNDSNGLYSVVLISTTRANNASMAVAGNFNGWNEKDPNMELVAPYTWQATFHFTNEPTVYFKFARNGSWNDHYGEINQTLLGSPLRGTSEVHNGTGGDIVMEGPLEGRYFFRINDQTRYYEVMPEGILQSFDTWFTPYAYGNYNNNGWLIGDGLTFNDRSRYGWYCRLDRAPASGQYLQTPFMANGIKGISFWYRTWDTNQPAVTYQIQTSTNGTAWVTNGVIEDFKGTNYVSYSLTLDTNVGLYVRLYHTGGGNQFLIDDFVITEPFADVVYSGVATVPEFPWSNDAVIVSGYIYTNRTATGLTARTYWRAGASGPFAPINMSNAVDFFTTTNAIPAQPPGTIVYYYLVAFFGGPGGRSPVYWPTRGSNNPASYGISRNRHGSIWVNEVNFLGDWVSNETNEFIEICGQSGSDIGLWTVELLDIYVPYAAYSIPANTLLPPDTNGFGFYVIGDSNVPNVNMLFTNVVSGFRSLASRGAIRLKNELGAQEYLLTYGDPPPSNLSAAIYIGTEPWDFVDSSLSLTGTGGNYTNFTWGTNTPISAGVMNAGQTLAGGYLGELPSLSNATILYVWGRTNMMIQVTGTNGWNAAPYYTTRITNQFPQWIAISPYNSTYANGISTINFDFPAGVTNVYFRIKTERSW